MLSILTVKRLVAIGLIYVFTFGAWLVLAGIINQRTRGLDQRLRSKVTVNWGDAHEQNEPQFTATGLRKQTATTSRNPQGYTYESRGPVDIDVASDVQVALNYESRKKGLLWYNLYKVDFKGDYTVENLHDKEADVKLSYQFPSTQAIYDNFLITVDGEELQTTPEAQKWGAEFKIPAKEKRVVRITYRSQGLDEWRYAFGGINPARRSSSGRNTPSYPGVQGVDRIKNFNLVATTNFKEVDFPENVLAPTEKTEEGEGWKLTWRYDNLISGQDIGIAAPKKLNPGPFVQRVTLFAPVSLFFFFFVLIMIVVIRQIPLHPMHFLFLAATFFSFHLLYAYLVDHMSLKFAFAVAAATSIFLTITYLRLVAGVRFALAEAGVAQLVYLIAFTYSFFFEGYTGLIIAILAVVTLFLMMQLTGRVNWTKVFARPQG